ncbi:MAG TPA: EAL domain-containing protein [Terriglobales bacterium]|nr:EAL domain-containing protein [Terriglobales bacterium]
MQPPGITGGSPLQLRQIEGREWWLWGFAVAVTLLLTFAIVSFTFPWFHIAVTPEYWKDLQDWVRGLAALVLLFDIYTIYQHLQLHRVRRQLAEHDQLFRLISENAADMIALVDSQGHRLYNSPAYQKVLGYSPEELQTTSTLEQVHPDDRPRVLEAAEKARLTGQGQPLEYRIRHKDGSWRILESTASAIRNSKGETEKLVIVNRDITERKHAEQMLVHNAFHDGLTDLPNRALFLDRLQHVVNLAKRHPNYKFAVLFIDVDEFKLYNDSLGHKAGDQLLIMIGQRLTASLRREDTVSRPSLDSRLHSDSEDDTLARLGGDEFTVLLYDIRDASDAIRVAERVAGRLSAPFTVKGQEIVISASIGIALSTTAHSGAEELLRDADIAMYRAKRAGKARCEVFDSAMHASAVNRLRLETDLRKALERGEFVNYYQPIVAFPEGNIVGFEALARWQAPQGLVPPAEFVGVANETGIILSMNRGLLLQACQHLCQWQQQFPSPTPLSLSMNVSGREFDYPDLAREIASTLQQTGLHPSRLQLEIMETIAMGDSEKAGAVMANLKALGVRLSIDDFGTGYSSLSRLQGFPVDSLKIDRSFISRMDTDRQSLEMVRIIVTLAHNFHLRVVAEGVETRGQADQLRELGCELAQGYLYSRPVPAQEVPRLLAQQVQVRAASVGI